MRRICATILLLIIAVAALGEAGGQQFSNCPGGVCPPVGGAAFGYQPQFAYGGGYQPQFAYQPQFSGFPQTYSSGFSYSNGYSFGGNGYGGGLPYNFYSPPAVGAYSAFPSTYGGGCFGGTPQYVYSNNYNYYGNGYGGYRPPAVTLPSYAPQYAYYPRRERSFELRFSSRR